MTTANLTNVYLSELDADRRRERYDFAKAAGSDAARAVYAADPTACWEDANAADIVYAARAAGVVLPLTSSV